MIVPADIASAADYERYFRDRADPALSAYIDGAGADSITARWNREAFSRLALHGRVLADMRGAHTRTRLCGIDLECPLLLAPVAYHRLVHEEGEVATALGASAGGVVMTVSTQASRTLEDIAAAATTPLLFQLYQQPDRADTLRLVRRVEATGYRALVVTVDAPVTGLRNSEQRAGFRLPAAVRAVNLDGMATLDMAGAPGRSPVFSGLLDHAPGWGDIEWLRRETPLPILLKGILHPDDARRALACGIDGLVVSNHGGRTLDTLPATLDALPAIATADQGRVPLLLDGGIRRGTDIVKALALGASAVLIGRPQLHALAIAGASGVAHLLTILRTELEVAMALAGCSRPDAIDKNLVWRP